MKPHRVIKSLIVSLSLALALPQIARADFNPVALTPGSYTYSIVVPSNTVPPVPQCVDFFFGSGTNFGDNTFYEQTLVARPGFLGANSGVPPHNTIFTNVNNANMMFLMPPTYTANDDLAIVNNSTYSVITTGTFTFNSPTTATSLAILDSGGNGGCTVNYTVNHQNGSMDTGSISVPDWFSSGPQAWGANGRMDQFGDYNNFNSSSVNNNAPYFFAQTFVVSSASPITSIVFTYSTGTGIANFVAVSAANGGATYSPVAVTGYNERAIIPAAIPFPVTATMDNGTNIESAQVGGQNPGNTWMEMGYDRKNPTFGLPPSGSTFNSLSQPTHHYQMGVYSGNDAILIDAGHLSANITPAAPAAYSALGFLTGGGNVGGNNVMTNICIIEHADGVDETNLFLAFDWFNSTTPAWSTSGRVSLNNLTLDERGGAPYLDESFFSLSDTVSPVTNILVKYDTAPGGNSTTFIMAVSATAGAIAPLINGPAPTNQAWWPGQTATISVQVSGTAPVTNQWMVESNGIFVPLTDGTDPNGSVVSGSATTTLTINGLTPADATNYEFLASDVAGTSTSGLASITILTAGSAGVSPIEYWNNIANANYVPGSTTELYPGTGLAGSQATLTIIGAGVTQSGNSGTVGNGGNSSLMDGFMNSGSGITSNAVCVISNLTGSSYNVYLYTLGDTTRPNNNGDWIPNYAVNGTTYYFPVLGGITASTFDATSTSVGGHSFTNVGFVVATTFAGNNNSTIPSTSDWGDYIIVSNVAPVDGTITIQPEADIVTFQSALNGIQLVNTGSGPNYGIHFLGNTTDPVVQGPLAPFIRSQSPNTPITALTNHPAATTFSVNVDESCSQPVSYQWYGVSSENVTQAIANATAATYVNVDTNNVTLFCVASNFLGTATSAPVSVSILIPPPPSPYASAVLSYGPVAYWPLNETSGTIALDYAGTNNGTYTGGYQLGQTGLPPTPGVGANTSVGFDGQTAYVDVPVGGLNIVGPVTVIMWVQPPSSGETHFATALGHSDQSYRLSVINSGPSPQGQARFADPGNPDIIDNNGTIADGNWHQLAGVYDGHIQYLYVDGRLVNSAAPASPPSGSGDDVLIGAAPDYLGQRNFQGNIAQVAIYSSALSAADIVQIYGSVDTAPVVSITPANPSVASGNNVTLTANLSGTPATSLQWYYIDTSNNSNNIALATNSTYTIEGTPLSFNGYTFGVIAANPYGTNTATVSLSVSTVAASLSGDIAPLLGEAYVGAPATYTVGAQGSLPITYQWTLNGAPVSGATNSTFTLATPCGTNMIQVSFTNDYNGGSAASSSQATLMGDPYPTNITFNTNGTGWQLNSLGLESVPILQTNVLELTDNTGGEASSAFYTTAEYVGSFAASFTYTPSGSDSADGTCFIIQNSSTAAASLGEAGGALGYFPLSNSIALEINLYQVVGIALGTNGSTSADGGGNPYAPTGPISVDSEDPIIFDLKFANGVLAVNMKDTITLATYSTNYDVGPLPPILGSSLAYVGFSGGDGGATSTQTISDFEFNSVITPVPLSASPAANHTLVVSWSAADPNYVLQTNTSLSSPSWGTGPAPVIVNGTNQVTVTIPNGPPVQFYRLIRVVCP